MVRFYRLPDGTQLTEEQYTEYLQQPPQEEASPSEGNAEDDDEE